MGLVTFTALALNDILDLHYMTLMLLRRTDFIEDKGGIMVNAFYDPPDSYWNGTSFSSYNLWLDNLYKTANLAVLGSYQFPAIKAVGRNALTHILLCI